MMRSHKRRDFAGFIRMDSQRFIGLVLVIVAFCAMAAPGRNDEKPLITREQCDAVAASRDRIAELVDAYASASDPGEGCNSIQELSNILFDDSTIPEKLVCYYRVRCVTLALELKSLVDYMARSAYEAQYRQERWIVLDSHLDKYIKTLDAARRGYSRALSLSESCFNSAYEMRMKELVDEIGREVYKISMVFDSVGHFVRSSPPRSPGVGRLMKLCNVNTDSYEKQFESYFTSKITQYYCRGVLAILCFGLLYDSLWNRYANYCVNEDMEATVDSIPGYGWMDKAYCSAEIKKARESFLQNAFSMKNALPMTMNHYMYPHYVVQVSCAQNVARNVMTWP